MIKLFKYIRGSQLYGLNTPESDLDTGAVYADEFENILSDNVTEFVTIGKGDDTEIELQKFIRLLIKSNPNMLEALFASDEFVIYKHPVFDILRDNKDMFLSKEIFKALGGYAISQIHKARGLNKKINNPIVEKPNMYDYMFVPDRQGSMPIKKYVEKHFIDTKYDGTNKDEINSKVLEFLSKIGITSIPNMQFIFGAYEGDFKGIISPDGHQLLFSSIPDYNSVPSFYIHYDSNKYSTACREYKEFKEWEQNRNEIRYKSNLTKNYDSKNMMHSFRLLAMAIEVAKYNKLIINRRDIDREFLLDIRNHKFEYDELITKLEDMNTDLIESIKTNDLPEHVDEDKARSILLEMRKKLYL